MQRHILATLLLAVFIALLGIGIIVPIMPVFAVSLGANGLTLGMIIAAFSISRAICQPVVGNLSDRLGRKSFLLCGLLIYAVVGLLIPHADSIFNLILIRCFHGVGSAMIVPVAMAYVSAMSPLGMEGRSMGLLNIAIFTGIGSGPLIGGFFADTFGMASAFYVMAGLSCLAMLLIFFQMPSLPCGERNPRPMGIVEAMKSMLSKRETGGILLARMATMLIMVPTMAFLPLLMHQWFQASAMEIGLVIAVRTLVNAILQGPCGRMADRLDKVVFLRIGCLVISIVMCLVPLAGSVGSLLGLFVVLGIGEAIIWPTLGALATQEGRRYGQGTMMGVFTLAMSCGVFLGSLSAGIISDWFGLHWVFFIIGFIVLILSMIATALIAPRKMIAV
ncbi:MAG: MFS transporter [Desulfobulbaceae bacterium DB1]|nr:MAG: MFS transporter [Desulfobulbaceae bacterium DB1]